MATNFPTSIDTFTNPNSGNTLDSPSHSIQHSDINDAVEAIEAKIGVGSSTAGSATSGFALVNTSGGTTAYSLLGVAGLSSGTAPIDTFLRADGAGAATFASTAQGLTLLVPSSVSVGGTAATGSVSATGTITFGTATSVSVNDVFSATYDNYKIIFDLVSNVSTALSMRLRVSGADNTTSNYNVQFFSLSNTTISSGRIATGTSWNLNGGQSTERCFYEMTLGNPFNTQLTQSFVNMNINYNSTNIVVGAQTTGFAATTSFTGFTLFLVGGVSPTITGTVYVYGINK